MNALPLRRLAGVALLAAFCLPAAAASLNAKPGLWEQKDLGDPDAEPDYECLTAQELGDSKQWIAKAREDLSKGCALTNVKEGARGISFDYVCSDAANKGTGSMSIAFETSTTSDFQLRYSGQVAVDKKSTPFSLDIHHRGRWVSADCGEHADDDEDAPSAE